MVYTICRLTSGMTHFGAKTTWSSGNVDSALVCVCILDNANWQDAIVVSIRNGCPSVAWTGSRSMMSFSETCWSRVKN